MKITEKLWPDLSIFLQKTAPVFLFGLAKKYRTLYNRVMEVTMDGPPQATRFGIPQL